MSDPRERLTALLAAATRDADGAQDFSSRVCSAVGGVLGWDFACLATTDPTTSLITGVVKTADTAVGDERFAHYEYEVDDVNQFTALAQRPAGTGVLVEDTAGRPELSARYREFLLPEFGLRHELRAVFRSGGRMWGALGTYRAAQPFTEQEAALLASLERQVADGLRVTLLRSSAQAPAGATRAGAAADGPAVVVVDARDVVIRTTAAAAARILRLGGTPTTLPTSLLSIVAASRRPDAPSTPTRLRDSTGQWLVAKAVTLGEVGETFLTIEPAAAEDVAPLALAAFGLTAREQQIAEEVLRGASTTAIAARLFLSPHTVQDHLKAVFAKAAVRSRRELIATVYAEHRRTAPTAKGAH